MARVSDARLPGQMVISYMLVYPQVCCWKRYQGASPCTMATTTVPEITTQDTTVPRLRRWTVLLRDGSLVTEQRHVVSLAKTLYNFLDAQERSQLSLCVCLCPEQEANSDLQLPITEGEVMQRVN